MLATTDAIFGKEKNISKDFSTVLQNELQIDVLTL
jgi:hypothetical protein